MYHCAHKIPQIIMDHVRREIDWNTFNLELLLTGCVLEYRMCAPLCVRIDCAWHSLTTTLIASSIALCVGFMASWDETPIVFDAATHLPFV